MEAHRGTFGTVSKDDQFDPPGEVCVCVYVCDLLIKSSPPSEVQEIYIFTHQQEAHSVRLHFDGLRQTPGTNHLRRIYWTRSVSGLMVALLLLHLAPCMQVRLASSIIRQPSEDGERLGGGIENEHLFADVCF